MSDRRTAISPAALLAALAVAVACTGCEPGVASRGEISRYRELRGSLVAVEATLIGRWHDYDEYRVRLESGTGLVATGRLLRPAGDEGPFPAVLLEDGRELNSEALAYLPPSFGGVVVLSLDYPAELPYELDISTMLRRRGELLAAARRIPAIFSLGGMYLASRSDVDHARVAIAATSFAVPFAVIAASIDDTFRNVALIYGAGDFTRVLAANLRLRPRALRTPVAWLVTRPAAELEPTRYVAEISPRPLVMVNGVDDPQMPRAAVQQLYDAAREPKSLIWLRTGHLMPDDSVLIRALVDTALARIPVLHH